MRRPAIIGAFLLVGVGVVLGATVFRSDIAQATGLAQSVTVDNTTANPVPVREQNLDASGSVKVHEQGTAQVEVMNASLPTRAADEEVSVHRLVEAQGTNCHIEDLYTVPTGKTFILEYVNSRGYTPSNPEEIGGYLSVGPSTLLWFPFSSPSTGSEAFASEMVHFAFPAGTRLDFGSFSNGAGVYFCAFDVSIGGYLQPSP